MTGHRVRDDRGAAVVVAVVLVGVLAFVAAVSVGTIALVLDHRRVQVAADLAALAGAEELQRGGDPCVAASRIAARHDVVAARCLVEGDTVLVVTSVSLPAGLGGEHLLARARAGPPALAGTGGGSSATPVAPR